MWENMAPIFKLGKFVMVKTTTPAIPEKIHSIVCDCCKTEFTRVLEIQEFLSFSDTAGYGNRVVSDMTRWSIDLCQDCWYRLLGKYIRRN
jgi:hypothetical protein